MASFLLSVTIPEDGFDEDEDAIKFRDSLSSLLIETSRLHGFPYNVEAEIEFAD